VASQLHGRAGLTIIIVVIVVIIISNINIITLIIVVVIIIITDYRVDHNIKGQGIYAYVVLAQGTKATPELKKKLNDVVRNQIGSFAVPDTIHWAPGKSSGVTFMLHALWLFWSIKLDACLIHSPIGIYQNIAMQHSNDCHQCVPEL